jgi:hypothetical protein
MSLMRFFCCLVPGCRGEAPEPREPREPPASTKAAETSDAEAFGAAAPKPLPKRSGKPPTLDLGLFVVQLQVGDGKEPSLPS